MAKRRDLPWFEAFTITARKIKGDIAVAFLVPPVFIGQVRLVLQEATVQNARSTGLGKAVGTNTHGRAAKTDALKLVVWIVESSQAFLHERGLTKRVLPGHGRNCLLSHRDGRKQNQRCHDACFLGIAHVDKSSCERAARRWNGGVSYPDRTGCATLRLSISRLEAHEKQIWKSVSDGHAAPLLVTQSATGHVSMA